jgi:hypothetical protein
MPDFANYPHPAVCKTTFVEGGLLPLARHTEGILETSRFLRLHQQTDLPGIDSQEPPGNQIAGLPDRGRTLSGTGVLAMSNNSANYLMGYAQPGGASVTNQSTIRGAGNIGWNGGLGTGNRFTNQGTINANQTTPLTIGVGNGTFTNTGMLEATNGATLVITGAGTLTNTRGIIHADPASIVSLASGATILGGALTTSGTGTIQAKCCFNDGTLNGVTNNGTFQLNNGNIEFLAGTITNNGSLQVNSTGSGSYLNITGDVTLTGTGALTMSNNPTNYIMGYAQASPGASLINQSGSGELWFYWGARHRQQLDQPRDDFCRPEDFTFYQC